MPQCFESRGRERQEDVKCLRVSIHFKLFPFAISFFFPKYYQRFMLDSKEVNIKFAYVSGVLRFYTFIFGMLNVGTSPCTILANGGISSMLSDCLLVSGSVGREWLQVLLSGSLTMLQPSAHLPTLDMALHIQVS